MAIQYGVEAPPTTKYNIPMFFPGGELNRSMRNADPNLNLLAIGGDALNDLPSTTAFNFGETGTGGGEGDFTRTTVDDYYTKLLQGMLSQPGTDFTQVNKPLEEYQKFASGMSPNAIPQAYTDLVKGVGSKSEQQFQDYLGMLKTPSSAEEAIRQTEGDILQQTMKDIDREIARSVADIKMTGEEYGISGAGRVSEPITAAIAGAQGRGLEQKAGARSQLALADLRRQADKDTEVRQAFRERYQRGPVEEVMLAQAYPQFAQMQQGEKELMYKVASDEATRRLQGLQLSSTERQNLVDNLFKTMLTGLEIQSKENITGGEFDLRKFLQQQEIEWDKQKTNARLDFDREKFREGLNFEQRQIDAKPGFWEGLGQNFLTKVTGSFGDKLGGGFGDRLSSL